MNTVPKNSRKWMMAFLLQEIIDHYIAPEHSHMGEIADARILLKDYWLSKEAVGNGRLKNEALEHNKPKPKIYLVSPKR